MISRSARLGDNNIYIEFDLLVHHIMEQGYHGSLVGHPSNLQAEWYDIIGISSLNSGECCPGFVLFSHLNLLITREPIHKGEENVGCGVINQSNNMWQGKIILRVGPIQISIINAHVYLPLFLWHENNVGNPIRIGYGSKKNDFQLLFHFFFDFQDSLGFNPSKGLPH